MKREGVEVKKADESVMLVYRSSANKDSTRKLKRSKQR